MHCITHRYRQERRRANELALLPPRKVELAQQVVRRREVPPLHVRHREVGEQREHNRQDKGEPHTRRAEDKLREARVVRAYDTERDTNTL